MNDHIKVLAEFLQVPTPVVEQMIVVQKIEKMLCDAYGVRDLSELNKLTKLHKQAEQAAAFKWLESQTAPKLGSRGFVDKTGDTQTASEPLQAQVSDVQTNAGISKIGGGKRTHQLAAVIEMAQEQCDDKFNALQVMNALRDLSEKEHPPTPLIHMGYVVEDEAIKFRRLNQRTGGTSEIECYTLKNLRDYLSRRKTT